MFDSFLTTSLIARAVEKDIFTINIHDIRQFGLGPHRNVDATPYGGGPGMLLRVDVVDSALKSVIAQNEIRTEKIQIILLTPQGQTFNQDKAVHLAKFERLIFICGHYEGFDERIRNLVDIEMSLGDFILTGGELPAQVMVDAIGRVLPNFLGKEASNQEESFGNISGHFLLEYPHYTRPENYQGQTVPKVLLSGHHGEIEKWRLEQAKQKTLIRRPDLLKSKGNQIDKTDLIS